MAALSDGCGTARSHICNGFYDSGDGEIMKIVAELTGDGDILQQVESMPKEERRALEESFLEQLLKKSKEAKEKEEELWSLLMELQEKTIEMHGYAYALKHIKRRGLRGMRKDNFDAQLDEVLAGYCKRLGTNKTEFTDASTITEENPEGIPRFAGLESACQKAHWNFDRLTRMAFYEQYIPTTSDCPPMTAFEEKEGEEPQESRKKKRKRRKKKNKGFREHDDLTTPDCPLDAEFREDDEEGFNEGATESRKT